MPAWAHGGSVPAGTSGGGTALLIILAAVIAFLVVYRGQKRWRRRKLERDGGAE
jgi:hypothetical protein